MPAAHVAHAKGVSRQCAHRWLARFDAEGLAGLHDRTLRPHRSPKRTCAEVEDRVVAARLAARRGPDRLGPELGSQRVIQRAHRVEGLTIPNPREPKFAQEPYEVAFCLRPLPRHIRPLWRDDLFSRSPVTPIEQEAQLALTAAAPIDR
jgi:hypothetical protein